jgi:hypothetical protein
MIFVLSLITGEVSGCAGLGDAMLGITPDDINVPRLNVRP